MSNSELEAPGWQALDIRFSSIYPDTTPHQFTSPSPYDLESAYPLPAITVWEAPASGSRPAFWHYLSYGLSELFEKTTDDAEHSGLGFELTFALPRSPDEERPPNWGLSLMQGLAAPLLKGELQVDTGSLIALGRPITGANAQGDTPSGCILVPDPVGGILPGPFGRVLFLRLLGLCQDELELCRDLELAPKIDLMAELSPHAITDPNRRSWAQDEQKAKVLRRYQLGIRL